MTDATKEVTRHVECFFGAVGQVRRRRDVPGLERTASRVPGFEVLVVPPGRRFSRWVYVTVGCWDAVHDDAGSGVEFVLVAPQDDVRHLRTLAMTAYYHAGPSEDRLDLDHTVPVGEPWLEGSLCDHLLVSHPHPFGRAFEECTWAAGSARLLWLLPITTQERQFKKEHGVDALEERFEDGRLEYWSPSRPSLT